MVQSAAERETTATPLLSVVLPVYNARGRLEKTIQSLRSGIRDLEIVMFASKNRSMEGQGRGSGAYAQAGSKFDTSPWYEIIVVNDGSTDDTKSVLDILSGEQHDIKAISYEQNMGKGYAIKRGILRSRGRYVVFMDGDGEIDVGVLAMYLQGLQDAEIVIASKYHPQSVVKVPATRRFLSKCFNLFVKTLIPLHVSDTQVGLKAGRGEAFRKIFSSVLVKRYAFDVEMLAVAQLMRLKVVEMPVEINLDARFRKKEIMRMFLDVLGIAYRLRLSKHYQKRMSSSPFFATAVPQVAG